MPSRFLTESRAWFPLVAVLALILFEARGFVANYVEPYQRQQWMKNARQTKLGVNAVEAELRRDNVFGHAIEARVLACEFTATPPDEKQRWDYTCFLYWGTAPGVRESIHEMKFGAMVDSSRITRLSVLVPAKGPDPPLSEAQ